jgi:hypothetical protein
MAWTASALGDGLPRQFPTTRWTLVLSLREAEPVRRAALAELLPLYWKPLYVFARRKGLASERAEDAVQGFFAHLLGRPSPSGCGRGACGCLRGRAPAGRASERPR